MSGLLLLQHEGSGCKVATGFFGEEKILVRVLGSVGVGDSQ